MRECRNAIKTKRSEYGHISSQSPWDISIKDHIKLTLSNYLNKSLCAEKTFGGCMKGLVS